MRPASADTGGVVRGRLQANARLASTRSPPLGGVSTADQRRKLGKLSPVRGDIVRFSPAPGHFLSLHSCNSSRLALNRPAHNSTREPLRRPPAQSSSSVNFHLIPPPSAPVIRLSSNIDVASHQHSLRDCFQRPLTPARNQTPLPTAHRQSYDCRPPSRTPSLPTSRRADHARPEHQSRSLLRATPPPIPAQTQNSAPLSPIWPYTGLVSDLAGPSRRPDTRSLCTVPRARARCRSVWSGLPMSLRW